MSSALTRRRGNQTKYDPSLQVERDKLAYEQWSKAAKNSKLRNWDLDQWASENGPTESIKTEDLQSAFSFLAKLTNDPAFQKAADVFCAYGFRPGSLKAACRKMIKESDAYLPALMASALNDTIAVDGVSAIEAARRNAVVWGVPGATMGAVTDDLRKAYSVFKAGGPPPFPDGYTGLKLRVKLGSEMLREAAGAATGFRKTTFDTRGIGIVPDNRMWRILIANGTVLSLGADPDTDAYRFSEEDEAAVENEAPAFTAAWLKSSDL